MTVVAPLLTYWLALRHQYTEFAEGRWQTVGLHDKPSILMSTWRAYRTTPSRVVQLSVYGISAWWLCAVLDARQVKVSLDRFIFHPFKVNCINSRHEYCLENIDLWLYFKSFHGTETLRVVDSHSHCLREYRSIKCRFCRPTLLCYVIVIWIHRLLVRTNCKYFKTHCHIETAILTYYAIRLILYREIACFQAITCVSGVSNDLKSSRIWEIKEIVRFYQFLMVIYVTGDCELILKLANLFCH